MNIQHKANEASNSTPISNNKNMMILPTISVSNKQQEAQNKEIIRTNSLDVRK